MASGHLGQICPRNCVQGLQDRVHGKTSDYVEGMVDGDPQKSVSKGGPRERSPVHVGQAGHKRDSGVSRDALVLLPDFPSSQGIGWLEADSQPQGFQQICSAPILSDGDTATVMDCLGRAAQQRQNTSEHLRDLSLSETWAISIDLRNAYFHVAVAPEHTRYLCFAYNGRAFEFLVLPFGLSTAPRVFTRIVNGHRGLPQSTRCRYAPVLGRLADEKSVKIPSGASPRFDAILGEQAGVPCERGQVPAHPHSGPCLPGFDLGSPEYAHVPERKEDSQGYPPSGLFASEKCPAGEDLAEVSRTPVQPP